MLDKMKDELIEFLVDIENLDFDFLKINGVSKEDIEEVIKEVKLIRKGGKCDCKN